ncbi:3-hydroxyacyl-ACP dehydratase FabZ [Candidatus Woesearchaeota archaeon]|nr:3-hydroxyacyl-ACP dehydratase FabZ [Candidatus Woesearchaeota archaeon]
MDEIDKLKNKNGEIEKGNLKKIIPYDEPFLMIDKVTYLDKKNIVAIKDIKKNEFWVKGHFAGFPIMPGALIIEGLGQAATLLVRYNIPKHKEKDILAYKIRKVKFMYPVFPGNQVRFEVKLSKIREKGALIKGKAFVDEKLCSEAKMILAIVNKERFRGKFKKN